MRLRPFILLGANALELLRREIGVVVDTWAKSWGIAPEQIELECGRAWEVATSVQPALTWRHSYNVNEKKLTLAWTNEMPLQLQRAIFGIDPAGSGIGEGLGGMAFSGAHRAWQSLLGLLAGAAGVADAEPQSAGVKAPLDEFLHASGAALLSVRIGKQVCHCLLNHVAVQALAPAASRVVVTAPLPKLDYRAALSEVALRLTVEAGRAEVGLGSLMTLGVGDVVRLKSAADGPLKVVGPDGLLFDAYLGLQDQMVAIEVAQSGK